MKQYYVLDSEPPTAEALEVERRRLKNGVGDDERILGCGALSYYVFCDGDATDVLSRIKDIMRAFNAQGLGGQWPEDDQWPELLPTWFADAFAPEKTSEEKACEQAEWQAMTYEQKLEDARTKKWSLSELVYFMAPGFRLGPHEARMWVWFDAKVLNDNLVVVYVDEMADAIPSEPPGLRWLFLACGAKGMEYADSEDMIRSLR